MFSLGPPKGVRREEAHNHLFPESDRQRGSNTFARQCTSSGSPPVSLSSGSPGHELRSRTTFGSMPPISGSSEPSQKHRAGGRRAPNTRPEGPGASCRAVFFASDLEWVSERRFQLDMLVEEAELDAARLAIELRIS